MLIEKPDPNVVDLIYKSKSNSEVKAYLMSDIHYDSCKCDVDMFHKHLRMAEKDKAVVMINGDLFDAMQSRDDPRRDPDELKQKYKVSSYTDALVIDVSDMLSKYKVPYIIGLGNHETAVLKKLGTNLIDRVCHDLNKGGGHAFNMGYYGFARFRFHYANGGVKRSKLLYWHHGGGGSSPVTKGVISTARQAVYLPDADVVWNGHNHNEYSLTLNRVGVNTSGKIVETLQHHVRTAGYKMGGLATGSRHGYDVEKHPAPTPRGCMILSFIFTKKAVEIRTQALLY